MNTKCTDCIPCDPGAVERARRDLPTDEALGRLSGLFKAMGDGTRLRILLALDQGELCVADLSVLLDMTKSAVSHQLSALRAANLIRAHKAGKRVYYALNDEHVRQVLETARLHADEGVVPAFPAGNAVADAPVAPSRGTGGASMFCGTCGR